MGPVPSVCGASGTSLCGLVNHAAALIGEEDEDGDYPRGHQKHYLRKAPLGS